ncbi:MAG: hypothetical protein H0V40_04425, partial [Actinobacteria bacterium]|nr:hypothetical protein [Actinomycetota bacterium]
MRPTSSSEALPQGAVPIGDDTTRTGEGESRTVDEGTVVAQSLARRLRTGRRALAGRYRRLEETGGVGRGVRFLFLAFATVNATTLGLVALLSADAREALRLPAAAVAIALALWWIRGFRRGSFPLAGELPEAAAILVCGLAVGPGQLDGILWIGLFFRSLYGGLPRALGRALLYAGAYVASVGFEPAGAPVLSELALGPVPGMLFASGLMVLLASVFARHEAALLRERSLTRASAALARSQDVESILAIGASAALEALGSETSRATVGIA